MSKHRPRGRKAPANPVRPQHGNEAKTGQQTVAKRPSTTRRRKPFYDREHRELRVGSAVVKRLRQNSDAVEMILLAFQEENWPYRIDDPLTGKTDMDPKQRLRRAVDNLNRRQHEQLIRFHVADQGTAVTWEFRTERR